MTTWRPPAIPVPVVCALVAVVAAMPFLPAVQNGFISFDDPGYIRHMHRTTIQGDAPI